MEVSYYLDSFLAPLADVLARDHVTDIWINRPGEMWIETIGGGIERRDAPALDEPLLTRLARQIAAAASQGISRAQPLLAARLPDGSRVQVVGPPATRGGHVFAIRRHVSAELSLADWQDQDAFEELTAGEALPQGEAKWHSVGGRDARKVLRNAVLGRKNILVSGGTSTGKTTFLNALLAEIPAEERLVLIEDTAELHLRHPNAAGLIAARGHLAEAEVSAEDLLIAGLRMRPDRIILGELRGSEASTFLRAVNTGHPGSMTTIHADTPQRAIEQLSMLILQGGSRLTREDVHEYVRASIDLFVQLERREGRRKVGQILARA